MLSKTEFEDSLNHVLPYWSEKSKEEVTDLTDIRVGEMVNYDQKNPHHCYDLFTHCLMTVCNLPENSSAELKIASFLHDLGKPQTAKWKNGRMVYYGHSKKSAEMADPLLKRIGYSDTERERICFLIGHHDDFICWCLPQDISGGISPFQQVISEDRLLSYLKKTEKENPNLKLNLELWGELLDLMKADAASQAEYTYIAGKQVDSRLHKMEKIAVIRALLENLIRREKGLA